MANFNFPPTSRYFGVEIATLEGPGGERIPFLRRRFLPPLASLALLREHIVTQGERMDLIASRELGDAEAFWRICDANTEMRPDDLAATPGRRVRITLPQGIPGMPTR